MPEIENNYMSQGGKPVEVAYVGTKEIKTDTLCRTGIIWFGQFDVQTVDAAAAARLLRFPSVFIRGEALDKFKADLEQSLEESDDEEEVIVTVSDATQDAPALADAIATTEVDAKHLEAIQAVIISLDQENSEHFTTKGKPRVEAVRARMPDVDVSADDIAEAYKGLEVA